MRRVHTILKRCTAAALLAVTLALSVGISVMDAHAVSGGPHFDGPQDHACSAPQHNHSLCEFLAASPVLGTVSGLPVLAKALEITLRLPESELPLSSSWLIRPRSRSPPAV